jgi:monofunctional biosynthetic peptidoglycan transglycosylase
MYLNVSEMGKGVYGIESAARHTFNKPAKNLSRWESSLIAASLPNPIIYTVKPLSRHVASRASWIIVQMNHFQEDPDIQKLLQ